MLSISNIINTNNMAATIWHSISTIATHNFFRNYIEGVSNQNLVRSNQNLVNQKASHCFLF